MMMGNTKMLLKMSRAEKSFMKLKNFAKPKNENYAEPLKR